MIVYLSLLIALIGVLLYFISANPKVQECGRIWFFCGSLAFLMSSDQIIKLLGK